MSYDVVCAHPYRIMRNADLTIDEDEAEDLLVEIQRQLKKRQWGEVIRLEVEDKMDERLLKILKMEFDIKEADIFEINGPLGDLRQSFFLPFHPRRPFGLLSADTDKPLLHGFDVIEENRGIDILAI